MAFKRKSIVKDSHVFEQSWIQLTIVSHKGAEWSPEAPGFNDKITIEKLKEMAISIFSQRDKTETNNEAGGSSGNSDPNSSFRIILLKNARKLHEKWSIRREKLSNGDILMIVRRKGQAEDDIGAEENEVAPDPCCDNIPIVPVQRQTMNEMVVNATRDLPEPNISSRQENQQRRREEVMQQERGQQLDGMLVSLNRLAAGVDLGHSRSGDFKVTMRQIVVTLINLMSTILRNSPDVQSICNKVGPRLKQRFIRAMNAEASNSGNSQSPDIPEVEYTPKGLLSAMVALKKLEFRPQPAYLRELQAFGFTEEEATNALRDTQNSLTSALEILTRKRDPRATEAEIAAIIQKYANAYTELDSTSHLFKVITRSPTIRLAMSNPKMLLVFLGFIDSAASANQWMNDPQVSDVYTEITSLYQSERWNFGNNNSDTDEN